MALCAILDFDNYIQFSQVELAKLLGMSQPNVNRSIGELCKRGIIIKGAKVGRSLTYRLSPTFGMKGKGSGFQKLMADVQEFAKARQLSEDELQRSELEARGQQRLAGKAQGAHQCRHEGAQLVGGEQSRPGAGGNLLGEPSVDPRKPGAKRQAGDSSMGAKPRPVWRNARPPGFNGPRLSVDVVFD